MASSKPNSLPATTARPTREQRCCQNAKGENLSSFHFPLWNPLLWKVRAQVRNWRRDTHAMTILRTRCTLDNSAFGISYASSASILARRAWKKKYRGSNGMENFKRIIRVSCSVALGLRGRSCRSEKRQLEASIFRSNWNGGSKPAVSSVKVWTSCTPEQATNT